MEEFKQLWSIIGYILAMALTAVLASCRKKISEHIQININSLFFRKPKPFRRNFSDRLNKHLDAIVIRTRCAARADRCYIYMHHHYHISMTNEDVEVGLKNLMPERQSIDLKENGKLIAFMRDIKTTQFRGIVEMDVVRSKCEKEDIERNQKGKREVVYLNRYYMSQDSIPAMLMRESSTEHVLLSPIIAEDGCIPYRNPKLFIVGVIGLDYIQKDVDIDEIYKTSSHILAKAQDEVQNLINVELMHTNLKKKLK